MTACDHMRTFGASDPCLDSGKHFPSYFNFSGAEHKLLFPESSNENFQKAVVCLRGAQVWFSLVHIVNE